VQFPVTLRDQSWRAKSMSDCNKGLNQIDEEILRDEVSDEALEAASVVTGGVPSLPPHPTYCFVRCRLPTETRDNNQPGFGAHTRSHAG
jgi:hypothetical protein